MKPIIREICQRDLIDVNNLLQDVSSFHAKPSELDSWYYDYLNDKQCYCAVAICSDDNLCVGAASIFYNHRIRGGISASIEDVVVHRSYRGLSIGSLLIKHLIDRSAFCFKFTLQCQSSVFPFYSSLGFVQKDLNTVYFP